MTIPLRIFISSPSDVNAERAAAARVIDRLAREFGGFFAIQAELWEQEPLRATAHFQEQIPRPSESDIVLVIVWSRLGTRLPSASFKGVLSGDAVTGTEWEFEEAARSFRETGKPDLLFYRKTARIDVGLDDANVEQRRDDKRRLDEFLHKWFFTETAEFKAAFSQFATTHDFEIIIEQHLRRMIQRRVDALDTSEGSAPAARWREGSPFRGLEPFDVEHAGIFYGRGRARMELREALTSRASEGSAFVLLLGMSGSGKSSLVRAALIPDLAVPGVVERVGLFRHGIMRPSDTPDDPLIAMANALVSNTALPELIALGWPAERVLEQLRTAPDDLVKTIDEALTKAGAREGLLEGAKARVILAVDQLEELFTSAAIASAIRDRFIAALHALVSSTTVWVVATMRSDMFHHLGNAPVLAQLAEGAGQYHLLPPQPVEISQMIREPAAAAGLRFEVDPRTNVGLDETLHQAMEDDPAALPLLEFTLDELFRARTPRGLLTYDAYNRLGGLEGALARRAEDVFSALPEETQAAFSSVASALAQPQKNANGFAARRAPMSDFTDDSEQQSLVTAFVQARLFVTDSTDKSGSTVRVAHEALFRSWPRMREALERNLRFIVARERLSAAADRWSQEGRAPDLLLQDGRLIAEAQEIMNTHARDLDSGVREYLSNSLVAAHARHTRVLRITRSVAAGFGFIALLAVGAGWFAWQSRIAADRSRVEAVSQRDTALRSESFFLAALSFKSTRTGDPVSGALLARAALPKTAAHPDRPVVDEAQNALAFALAELGPQRGIIRHSGPTGGSFMPDGTIATLGGKDPVRLSRAPDGKLIATFGTTPPSNAWLSDDHRSVALQNGDKIDLYDRATTKHLTTVDLSERRDSMINFAISADFKVGAAFYATGGVKLLSLPSGHGLASFSNGSPALFSRFDAKTHTLLWCDYTGKMMVLNTDRPATKIQLQGQPGIPPSIAISTFGDRALAAGADGIVRLWQVSNPTKLQLLRGHTKPVTNVQFSSDSRRIVSVGLDQTARVWDTQSGALLSTIVNVAPRAGAAISPDNKRIAVATAAFGIEIHDAKTSALLSRFTGHTAPVTSLSFSPDGRLLLSTSEDGTARIWEPGAGSTVPVLDADMKSLDLVGITAKGRPFAADQDGKIAIWRAGTSRPPTTLSTGVNFISAMLVNPDATLAVTAAMANAQLWSLADASGVKSIGSIPDMGVVVTGLSHSPTGDRVLATGTAGTAVLLDGASGAVRGRFQQQGVTIGGLSADGSTAFVRHGSTVWIRDGRTLAPRRTIDISVPTSNVIIAQNGVTFLAAHPNDTLTLWNASTGRKLHSVRVSGLKDAVFANSPSSHRAAIVVGRLVTVIDTAHGTVLATGLLPASVSKYASLSPDGTVLAMLSLDGGVQTVSIPSFRPILKIPEEWLGARTVFQPFAFSPDSRHLALRWHDTQLRLWPVDRSLDDLIARADKAIPRPLSPAERALLILSYN